MGQRKPELLQRLLQCRLARRRAGRHDRVQCGSRGGRRPGSVFVNDNTSGAQHVASLLMRESLVDKQVIAGTEAPVRAILPR